MRFVSLVTLHRTLTVGQPVDSARLGEGFRAPPRGVGLAIAGERTVIEELAGLADELARSGSVPVTKARLRLLRNLVAHVTQEQMDLAAAVDALTPARTVMTPARVLQARRNAEARTHLLQEFGAYSTSELATLREAPGKNPSALPSRWLADGRVFAIKHAGERRFPAFQFDVEGQPLPVIKRILDALEGALAGWEVALWFTTPNGYLDGTRPVDALQREPDEVVAAAGYEAAGLQD